jgi:hypothetical protein
MHSKLTLGITILALSAAGCAGDPTTSAVAGGMLAPAPVVDAVPMRTLSGGAMISPAGVTVTGRDWNCPRCYK